MPARRLLLFAVGAFVAAGLMSYALTYKVPAKIRPPTMVAYNQQTFDRTRSITATNVALHSLAAQTDGNDVEVTWYDSALAQLQGRSGVYASLFVDGQPIASALSGSYSGVTEIGPATLRWAGPLPAGMHHFQVTLAGGRAQLPYVPPGHIGVDSLVVSQEPGGG